MCVWVKNFTYHTSHNSEICRNPTSTRICFLGPTGPKARSRSKHDSSRQVMLEFRNPRRPRRRTCYRGVSSVGSSVSIVAEISRQHPTSHDYLRQPRQMIKVRSTTHLITHTLVVCQFGEQSLHSNRKQLLRALCCNLYDADICERTDIQNASKDRQG